VAGGGAKFRSVRQVFFPLTKLEFAVTGVRYGVRAANGMRPWLF